MPIVEVQLFVQKICWKSWCRLWTRSLYLQLTICCATAAVTINGTCKVGLNLLVFTIHPMKLGATLMSSFLFNVALVLLASTAVIQFCSQAFSLYAYQTAIYEIFGNQVIDGLKSCPCIKRQTPCMYVYSETISSVNAKKQRVLSAGIFLLSCKLWSKISSKKRCL